VTLRYLLDTHAAIWLLEGSPNLGTNALAAIEEEESVALADLSLLEVALLAKRGTIALKPNLETGLAAFTEKLVVVPLDASIAADAVSLALPQRDPFDRVITATARVRGLTLITKDRHIIDAAVVPTLW
jgi:PIN domain nuclease of toxin-antitoxin system